MVDPYDFIASPTKIRAKQTRRKSIIKTTKRRKSNEKPRRASIRQANNRDHMRTRSDTRDIDHLIDSNDKENNSNHGFTQLIQTKMMEVKKRQGKRPNKKTNPITDDSQSPSVTRKRQRSNIEDSSNVVPTSTETDIQVNEHPPSATDEPVIESTTATTYHPRCESKDHHLVLANKRRRACLCSKRQLDELEFASDSISTQHDKEEQQAQEEPQPDPLVTSIHHSPPPLLLPSSLITTRRTLTFPLPSIQALSRIEHEDDDEEGEEEEEKQSNVPSKIVAPLSPAMPLNSTYMARRSIPVMTQISATLLDLSTFIHPNTTTMATTDDPPTRLTSSIIQVSDVEHKQADPSSLSVPIESTSNQQDQGTSMTPTVVQPIRCSISTQTNDADDDVDYHQDHRTVHHQCNDVSLCPCVQIYTRSEQLFMTSMAVFFRNSISVSPAEPSLPSLTTISNTIKKNSKRQQLNQQTVSSQPTPIINEIEVSNRIQPRLEKADNVAVSETDVIDNNNGIVPSIELEGQRVSPALLDTSTVINETRDEHTKKSDGSSIQIHLHPGKDVTGKSHEETSSCKPPSDQDKFKSLVLTMTALKDDQKIEFNRFIERFSVRSSTSVDDTTTHLITDEDNKYSLICPLTGKVLQAVTRHLTIVSYRWLTACLIEQRYVDETPTYEIKGDTIYNEHQGMSLSRMSKSNNHRLFANYAFHLKCHGCQPFLDNRPLIELIHLSGGLILKTLNQHIDNIGRQIIILCSKTYLQNKPALQQACQKLHILCVEPEWLVASIVKFELQPYESWLCTLYF